MHTPIRRRQLRGLVLHHRRHPAEHPRRLVNRTASWGEPPVNGICRWCYEPTASIKTRWHRYCLNIYRVASGQHPDEIQHTLCEICGDSSEEMDHRLAIEVARTLGPAAMLRAFTPENLRWLCRGCHKRRPGRTDCWRSSCRPARSTGTAREECCVSTTTGCSLFCCRAAWSLRQGRGREPQSNGSSRGHAVPDSSRRRCPLCKLSWYFLALASTNPRADSLV